MADENGSNDEEKPGALVHWFFALISIIYGTGFLISFTFFNMNGVDSLDFAEARYIHIGVLFFMAVLVIVIPIWWIIWPYRTQFPNPASVNLRKYIFRRRKNFKNYLKPIGRPLVPSSFKIHKIHGIHANTAVRISMILILWSFIALVMFAAPTFGRDHPKLGIGLFLAPMVVLLIGFIGDLFKGGHFPKRQLATLRKPRTFIRCWWLFVGAEFLVAFPFETVFFEKYRIQYFLFYFVPPTSVIIYTFSGLLKMQPRRRSEVSRRRIYGIKIIAFQWLLYCIQWEVVILQCWLFIWTIRRNALGVSLSEVLFGDTTKKHNVDILFPHGGIYFIFMVVLIAFFYLRNAYRITQIERTKDAAHKAATNTSMYLIIAPLSYIAILAFAHTIYPYIPYEKGGGDYTRSPIVRLTFNQAATTKTGLSIVVPPIISDLNESNRLILFNENDNFVFVADKQSGHGPFSWRNSNGAPVVYEISRDAISAISPLSF